MFVALSRGAAEAATLGGSPAPQDEKVEVAVCEWL